MRLAKSYAISLMGLSGTVIEIEAEISSNLPNFVLVGLPDASLSESKDRVRAAIHNSGFEMPARRVTVNLSPASVPKQGASFDLAIAVGILAANGALPQQTVSQVIHIGELGLDGQVRRVSGVLPSLIAAAAAGFTRAIVPMANLSEAKLALGIDVVGAVHLAQVAQMHGANVDFDFASNSLQQAETAVATAAAEEFHQLDISDVLGQEEAIDALTVAAAGGHHLLMVGPPGAGKTMLAERLPTLLPDLSMQDAIETTAVYSIAGHRLIQSTGVDTLIVRPPFQAPHHTSSVTALVGGGMGAPRPGLISLANHGVLFLDEAPEFQLPVLESLRQPLESGQVVINRSGGTAKFPAEFQLVLAANPCPCGHNFGKATRCICSAMQKMRYASKLSGPLLDRVDIRFQISPAAKAQLAMLKASKNSSNTSAQLRQRVAEARNRAQRRLAQTPWSLNSKVPGSYLRKHLPIDEQVGSKLQEALDKGAISMRGFDRCLRLAWTQADLAGRNKPNREDLAEAIFLRGKENPMEFGHDQTK